MAVPSPVENGSQAVGSDKGLGEMVVVAGAMSRRCLFLPIFWFYFKENTAHSSLKLLSFGYKGKNTKTSPPGWLTSPRCASHFKPQLSGSLLCLLGSPPAWPLQINTHILHLSHSWQQRASCFWDGVRGGGGRIRAGSHTQRYVAGLVRRAWRRFSELKQTRPAWAGESEFPRFWTGL